MANMIGIEVVLQTYSASLRLFKGAQLTRLAAKKGIQRKRWFYFFQESDSSLRARLLREFAKKALTELANSMWTRNPYGHVEVMHNPGYDPQPADWSIRRGDKWKTDDECPFC